MTAEESLEAVKTTLDKIEATYDARSQTLKESVTRKTLRLKTAIGWEDVSIRLVTDGVAALHDLRVAYFVLVEASTLDPGMRRENLREVFSRRVLRSKTRSKKICSDAEENDSGKDIEFGEESIWESFARAVYLCGETLKDTWEEQS